MVDPLKIYYLLLLEPKSAEEATAFQLYSPSWSAQHWALDLLTDMPCDILERTHTLTNILAHRIGGLRALAWTPADINVLDELTAEQMGVFIVCLTGEESCYKPTVEWIKAQPYPVLHISAIKGDDACHAASFTIDDLHNYCKRAFSARPQAFSDEQRQVGEAALKEWKPLEPIPLDLAIHGHNVTRLNYASLRRSQRALKDGQPFVGTTEDAYTKIILESAFAVLGVREEIGIHPVHAMAPPRPAIILAEPALVRANYKARKPEGEFKDRTVARAMRWIQTQSGLCSTMDAEFAKNLLKSRTAKMVIAERQSELETFTLGVGLFAAQTASCVVRLSPGVNHVFSNLAVYAQNIRSSKLDARLKTRKLFDRIQESLEKAVGKERIEFIDRHIGPLKIISDAPIEWLQVGDLPLGIRYDCSRLNATPGNLLMGLLTEPVTVTFTPADLKKILVVSAFKDDDPLRTVLTEALEAIRPSWGKTAEVIFKTAKTTAEFMDILNAFDGYIMIFDGHGSGNAEEPVGKLMIAGEEADVWSLRGNVRVPPIVILSACDTHGVDASSQATVGNGFLAIGARTVLATLLPVGGLESASFISRLVYRIADFIPAALVAYKRVLTWTEIVGGMLRMLLASEILDALVGPPAGPETARGKLQTRVNLEINSREIDDWFQRFLAALAEVTGRTPEFVALKVRAVIARSEAIRYAQLGNPETILIDDGEVNKRVLAEYAQMQAEAGQIPPQEFAAG